MISTAQTQNLKTQQDELVKQRLAGDRKAVLKQLAHERDTLKETSTALAAAKAELGEAEQFMIIGKRKVAKLTNDFSTASDAIGNSQSRLAQIDNQLSQLGR